ncbi:MAG: hypothetical protein Q8L34_06485 [Candidatus Woesearchaeota archaeon]|nr:hypothetical protein [Candidatus Woesearchaeota archaeon]
MTTIKQRLMNLGKTIKDAAYWTTYYTVGFSSVNGLGNGLANYQQGNDFSNGFGEAYINNFAPGLIINLLYPMAHNHMQRTDHYRLFANLFNVAVGAAFVGLHAHLGTENPLAAVLPSVGIGAVMTNAQVSQVQQTLESKLQQ